MAIKPTQLRKSSSKNAPILSHEFVIQNHADIVSCFAIVFVVGLLVQVSEERQDMAGIRSGKIFGGLVVNAHYSWTATYDDT